MLLYLVLTLLSGGCVFTHWSGVRGVTLDTGVLEECAYIHEDVLDKLILPLTVRDNFAVIAISTAGDDSNHFSQMLNARSEDGKSIPVVIRAIQACKECIAKGIPADCDHKKGPSWHNDKKKKQLRSFRGENQDDYLRETLGIVANSSRLFIFRTWMKPYLDSKPCEFTRPPQVIFVGIDPSGGGMQSQYAIVAVAKDPTTRQTLVSIFFFLYATLFIYRHT